MNKMKISMKKIRKYLREVSVVVLGVAITLSVSVWLNNRSEKRAMELYLKAIKIEMEENIQLLEKEIEYYEDMYRYTCYLKSHNEKTLHSDSIMDYSGNTLGEVHNVIFQTSAFEMFKISGTMRLMNDKELIQSIWKAYLSLEDVAWNFNFYYQLKTEEMKKDVQSFQENGSFPPIPLYNFLIIYHNSGRLNLFKDVLEALKETSSKLENENN